MESSAILGNYAKSPFTFKRSWQVIGGMLDNAQMALQSENNYLKSSLDDLKSQMSTLVTMLQSQQNSLPNNQRNQESDSENESLTAKRNSRRKGKKLLKKQKTTNSDRQSTSFLGRIYNTFQNTDGNSDPDGMSDLQSVNEMEARPSDLGLGLRGTTTDYWIESLELELMSAPLDQLRSRSSQDEAMADYIRLQRTLNQFNQVFSSAISYEHFLRGAYIGAFDLTSNAQPGLAYAINTVRTGNFF